MENEANIPVKVPTPKDFIPLLDCENKVPVATYISNWAGKEPDRPAMFSNGSLYTYGELNERSNQIANGLLKVIGNQSQPVGILFEKDALAIISTLATLKSGNFYAGFDPSSPISYLQIICDDLEPAVILTNSMYFQIGERIAGDNTQVINVEQWLNDMQRDEPAVLVPMNLIAGIYYTSGTTGKPKGVVLDQKGLWHRTYASVMTVRFSPSDRTCMPFPIGFGWSTTPLFGTLVTGGTIFLYDLARKPVIEVADWFLENKITYAPLPVAFLKRFLSGLPDGYASKFPNLRLVFVGGDAIEINDLLMWQKCFSSTCVFAYGFSSTEGGPITRTFYKTDTSISEDSLMFGMPADGVEIMIVDKQGNPVAPGTTGEIAVRSPGVMVGYWKKPTLNRTKFIDDPENPGGTLLLSGDMGRMDDNNLLEFTGRKDSKVKIRGYLVDIANVEAIIRGLPIVEDAAITPYKRKSGGLRLAAYIVLRQDQPVSRQELKQLLVAKLPSYMVPQYICVVNTLPRSVSGKVNTYLLPTPTNERPSLETDFVPPQSEIEMNIASIWRDVLEVDEVGIHDNFFDLGGDSLSVLEMILLIEQSYSITIPQSFFSHPTISRLQDVILDESNYQIHDQKTFALEGFNDAQRAFSPEKKAKRRKGRQKKLLQGGITAKRIERFVDLMVARYITSLSYQEANRWIVKWSHNPLVRRLFYHRRYSMFINWLKEFKNDPFDSSELFQRSMITNLTYRLRLYRGEKTKVERTSVDVRTQVDRLRKSPSKYWSSLGELIEMTPLQEFNNHFPVNGLHHLTDAIEEGNGVILLSFHGFMVPLRFLPLKWRLGIDIFTISNKMPLYRSRFHKDSKDMSGVVRASLKAEIALFGQRILQKGGIINIIGDSNDPYGRSYQISVGDRAYEVKSGFAEIAINTGAKVIPHFGRSLPDGRPEMTILPPFLIKNAPRNEVIEDLIDQYSAFINHVWVNYPEAVRWVKIDNYYSQPLVY